MEPTRKKFAEIGLPCTVILQQSCMVKVRRSEDIHNYIETALAWHGAANSNAHSLTTVFQNLNLSRWTGMLRMLMD